VILGGGLRERVASLHDALPAVRRLLPLWGAMCRWLRPVPAFLVMRSLPI
jgi:hypothetical protein